MRQNSRTALRGIKYPSQHLLAPAQAVFPALCWKTISSATGCRNPVLCFPHSGFKTLSEKITEITINEQFINSQIKTNKIHDNIHTFRNKSWLDTVLISYVINPLHHNNISMAFDTGKESLACITTDLKHSRVQSLQPSFTLYTAHCKNQPQFKGWLI